MASMSELVIPAVPPQPIRDLVQQSRPVDFTTPYSTSWLKSKTILITGGASGFGAAFCRQWATAGANIIVGDINDGAGEALVEEMRKTTGNQDLHYVHCDVTDWDSQVHFFQKATELSSHGGIDVVVANAGIAITDTFMIPSTQKNSKGEEEPRRPNLKILEVNLLGVLYTAHLAFYHLPKNPGSSPAFSVNPDPEKDKRDKCLLLIGSLASLVGIPGQALYGTSKHGVLGLFRSLRASSFALGIRLTMLCPYFIDTPLLSALARSLLAGGAMGKTEDVVDAASRLVSDTRIRGRVLVVGPKVKVRQKDDGSGQFELAQKDTDSADIQERAVWEAYADDFEESDTFSRRFVGLLSAVTALRGWIGWASDIAAAIKHGVVNRQLVR
ncbi:MAG: hypothetical protein M1821_005145 [Bathelium mastoideum]|nr:MAG: hypothetical protein M1821_005145 [Bathelium mastoideum]